MKKDVLFCNSKILLLLENKACGLPCSLTIRYFKTTFALLQISEDAEA